MGLPNIYFPPPGPDGWNEYWFNHYNDHLDIIAKLQSLNIPMVGYIIYPWVSSDKDGILEAHQQFHNDMNAAIGIAGSDLSDFDPKNENEMKAWVYLNLQEHTAAHSALGI